MSKYPAPPTSSYFDAQHVGNFLLTVIGTNGGYSNLNVLPANGMYVNVGPTGGNGVGAVYTLSDPNSPPQMMVSGVRTSNLAPIGPIVVPATSFQISTIECTVSGADTACKSLAGIVGGGPPTAETGYVCVATVNVPAGTVNVTSGMITLCPAIVIGQPTAAPSMTTLPSPYAYYVYTSAGVINNNAKGFLISGTTAGANPGGCGPIFSVGSIYCAPITLPTPPLPACAGPANVVVGAQAIPVPGAGATPAGYLSYSGALGGAFQPITWNNANPITLYVGSLSPSQNFTLSVVCS